MGYPDIYNSQILKTVPSAGEEYMTNEKEGKYLTLPDLPHTQQTERIISSSPLTKSELPELNVPTVITEKAGIYGTSEPVLATAHEVSVGFAEAQEFLNKSVSDLLEMTGAMSEEMCEDEMIPAHDLDNDIQRVLLGEDDTEELEISHV